MSLPSISVVVTTHERPRLLARALRSIRDQGVDDVEIVVVADEGSADTARSALSGLGPRDIFVKRNGPPGPARSRNLGLTMAGGATVVFLDDDDCLADGAFARLAALGARDPGVIRFWDYAYVVETRGEEAIVERQRIVIDLGDVEERGLFVRNRIPNFAMALPRLSAQRCAFDERLRSLEDWDFLLALLQAGLRLAHVPGVGGLWCNDHAALHRNPIANDVLLPDYLSIYRKWPAPDDETRQARRTTLAQAGMDVPLAWL